MIDKGGAVLAANPRNPGGGDAKHRELAVPGAPETYQQLGFENKTTPHRGQRVHKLGEARLLVIDKGGAVLVAMPKAKGRLLRGSKLEPRGFASTLADLEITKQNSHRGQRVHKLGEARLLVIDKGGPTMRGHSGPAFFFRRADDGPAESIAAASTSFSGGATMGPPESSRAFFYRGHRDPGRKNRGRERASSGAIGAPLLEILLAWHS